MRYFEYLDSRDNFALCGEIKVPKVSVFRHLSLVSNENEKRGLNSGFSSSMRSAPSQSLVEHRPLQCHKYNVGVCPPCSFTEWFDIPSRRKVPLILCSSSRRFRSHCQIFASHRFSNFASVGLIVVNFASNSLNFDRFCRILIRFWFASRRVNVVDLIWIVPAGSQTFDIIFTFTRSMRAIEPLEQPYCLFISGYVFAIGHRRYVSFVIIVQSMILDSYVFDFGFSVSRSNSSNRVSVFRCFVGVYCSVREFSCSLVGVPSVLIEVFGYYSIRLFGCWSKFSAILVLVFS